MFIFLAVFIIFVLILNFAIHKNNHSQENVQEQFWENERQANFTRRKDIHILNYLTIPIEKIPQNLHTDAEKTLVRLSSDKMLNLSGITNTELKLEYGAANLDELSSYDANFTEFVSAVNTYAQELLAAHTESSPWTNDGDGCRRLRQGVVGDYYERAARDECGRIVNGLRTVCVLLMYCCTMMKI